MFYAVLAALAVWQLVQAGISYANSGGLTGLLKRPWGVVQLAFHSSMMVLGTGLIAVALPATWVGAVAVEFWTMLRNVPAHIAASTRLHIATMNAYVALKRVHTDNSIRNIFG
jgi:hypothetical protein